MAKKLVGFFQPNGDLNPEEQKRTMVDAVMKRLEELGVFDEEEKKTEKENE